MRGEEGEGERERTMNEGKEMMRKKARKDVIDRGREGEEKE